MIPLLRKNMLVTIKAPATWWALSLYWIILGIFKLQFLHDEGFTKIGNILFAFVLTNVLISICETEDGKIDMTAISVSLPVSRKQMVFADYSWCLIMTLIGIAYTFIAGSILFTFLPKNHFADLFPISAAETSLFLVIMIWAAAIHTPISFRVGSYTKRPAILFMAILATLFWSFWILPAMITTIKTGGMDWIFHAKFEVFGPALMAIDAMGDGVFALSALLVSSAVLGFSIGISMVIFQKKDL